MSAIIITPAFSHARHELHRAVQLSGLPWLPEYEHSDLPRVRSILIEEALRHGAERVLFVDADTIPLPADLCRLAEGDDVTPERAVWGLYPLREGDRWSVCPEEPEQAEQSIARGQQFRILTGGLGVCAVHRESLERAVAHSPTLEESSGLTWRPFCVPFLLGGKYYADDGSLCLRLRTSGTALWCDPLIRAAHAVTRLVRDIG